MHAKHQQGKGLFSFMAGSIAALIAIAGVLITLNHNKERDFKNPATSKQQPASQNDQTEVLLPSNVPASAAKQANNSRSIAPIIEEDESVVASTPRTRPAKKRPEPEIIPADEEPIVNKDKSTKPEAARRAPDMMDDPVLGDLTDNDTPPDTKPRKPAESKANDNRQPEKAKLSEAEKRRRQQEDIADRNAKPTAEQILNSGSIEKAREVARQEAQAKRAKQRAAEDAKANRANQRAEEANAKSAASKTDNAPAQTKESKADKSAAPSSKASSETQSTKADTSRTTEQAGAYNTRRAAEAQRAKLALMGVNTQIVEVQSNGKTLYRVQTRGMDSKRANQVRETLQQNGVNSISRKQ